MRRSVVFCLFALLAWDFATSVATAAPIPTAPIHTNRRKFRIPFRFDAAEMARLRAREIRLYVTPDSGKNWRLARTVAPNAGRFDFEVSGDGEFWFAVRTVDHQGGLHPRTNGLTPGLKVVVDTTVPLFNVALEEREPGKVDIHWSASDEHLEINSLRIQFIRSGDADWQDVKVEKRISGTQTMTLNSGGLIAVRGVVVDKASNQANSQAQIRIAPASEAVPKPNLPPIRVPIANDENSLPQQFPAQAEFPEPHRPQSTAAAPPATLQRPLPNMDGSFQDFPVAAENASMQQPSARSVFQNTGQPNYVAPPQFKRQPAVISNAMPSGRYRAVNGRNFQIEYRLDDVGPSGVDLVEMYITQDEGRKWYRYGTDADRQSPFTIQVPADGVYGFALRVRSGAGVVEPPPQPGDRPDIMTLVDATPPKVEMLPLQQGQGDARHKIRIRWSAEDENLGEKPVALFYAVENAGPWEPITGWMENRSVYIWNTGADVPSQIYVRLAVRDVAGNVTRVETPRPVVIDLSRPSARIVDIESAVRPRR